MDMHAETAKFNNNTIRYSSIKINPGEKPVLISTPWSFLSSFLLKLERETKACDNPKHKLEAVERAKYFSNLAEEFYHTSDLIHLPAKGTLIYYGMLNLVKCYLSLQGICLEEMQEHHGLTIPTEKNSERNIPSKIKAQNNNKDSINIFYEFAKALNKNYENAIPIDFHELVTHIPELHNIYSSLTDSIKSKLLPVEINFFVNEEKNALFTELAYKKGQANKVDVKKLYRGLRKEYFREAFEENRSSGVYIVHRSREKKTVSCKDSMIQSYHKILSEYRHFDIASILTRNGYNYYVDLKPYPFHFLSCSLAAVFYVGSAARYRPLEMIDVMSGELRPLITELMSLTPKQFLYHMVSIITGKECVIPHSA